MQVSSHVGYSGTTSANYIRYLSPHTSNHVVSVEYVHCHAIKNKIKNHAVDKVKKLTIDKEDISQSLSCQRCPKVEIFVEMFCAKL